MKSETSVALAVFVIVSIVAVIELITLTIDDADAYAVNYGIVGRINPYQENTAKVNWQPYLGGRGRRYIEDTG